MARKKKKYNLKSRITSALRKVWLYSPQRREVVKRCKVGKFARCEKCKGLCHKVQIDHITPVALLTGWDENWTSYIQRLMIDSDGLRGLCEKCHKKITAEQREIRKKNKKK